MPTTEHTINDALAEALRGTRKLWQANDVIRSENTGMLKGGAQRPDILVIESNVSPVALETEVVPATTVEADALSRLGAELRTTGRRILSSIAIRMPGQLRTKSGAQLKRGIVGATDLEMALYTGRTSTEFARWPRAGWIRGGVAELSILTQSASVPPEVIDHAADQLVSGVSEVAGMLDDVATTNPGAVKTIAKDLCQQDDTQTRRMAATILANAFVFHESLAGGPGALRQVKAVDQLRGESGALPKSAVLAEWRKILNVNYWPIFDIARRILETIPASASREILDRLAETAERMIENQLMRSHDLTGAVFQRLIADRKFLAAYYTTPASAALLAGLTIPQAAPPGGRSWAHPKAVAALAVADFACGTGTLLSTAYQRIGQLHELAGGDSQAMHPELMAHGLVGCDVLPAAAHLTASMLAGAHPTVKYKSSRVMTVAYGRQPDSSIALGSLDLLDPQGQIGVLSITARAAEGMGEAEREVWSSLPHASFDLVIMNPPFTRATGHEGEKVGVPNPMFAAFASSEEEQRLMGAATKRLTEGTSAHGNAGEASIFLVLADRKLKAKGALGLVMPLSLLSGDAWEKSRQLLARNYSDLILVSISGVEGRELSFSADTGMGECLVIGRKSSVRSARATFVVLESPLRFPMLGAITAREIRRVIEERKLRRLEDGPVGGTPINFGDDVIAQALDAPLAATGAWHLSRVADLALAQSAYQLSNKGKIWLPSMPAADAISVALKRVGEIGEVGPYHMDINGDTATGGVRGPFTVASVKGHSVPTYPVLWAHDAAREFTMAFDGDSEGVPRQGRNKEEADVIAERIKRVWATASHCHFNRDFRFNSQATGMQFTPRKTIGGRAWLSIRLPLEIQEKALVVWGNSSLGILVYWWYANKQQDGRGSIGKTVLHELPTLDVTALTKGQLEATAQIFNDLANKAMRPVHEIDDDPVRKELDVRFAREVLKVPAAICADGGPLELLRMKLAKEPSIRGHKES